MLAPYAVYTILHRDALNEIAKSGRARQLRETKRWVAGRDLFDEAQRQGQAMAILYGDATECSSLLYWGRLTRVDVDSEGTGYTVDTLIALSQKKTQELVLRSTNAGIAEGFIRPYAIVQTPAYLGPCVDISAVRNSGSTALGGATDFPHGNDRASQAGIATLFSFGYWGCGSATPSLVKAVDEAESQRGFEPPLWVDVRISRSVRAAGFRDRHFEELLKSRYEWMPDLGNKCVPEGRKGIEIKNPSAAKELLQRALDQPTRRVIFFCSCEYPAYCHRTVVGQLVLKYAKERKAQVTVIEWPGGEPGRLTIEVLPAALRQFQRGEKKGIPIPSSISVGDAAALPWGTIATMQAGEEQMKVLVGPASFNAAGSHLRVFPDESGTRAASRAFRADLGFSALKSSVGS
jgi:hypothetical protein